MLNLLYRPSVTPLLKHLQQRNRGCTMLQLSELRPHTRNIHHVSEAGWSSKTRWPVGWSPGKIIYNLWEPLSIKMLCLSPVQLHLKATDPRVVLFGMRKEKGIEKVEQKWMPEKCLEKQKWEEQPYNLQLQDPRSTPMLATAFALWPQMTRVFVMEF